MSDNNSNNEEELKNYFSNGSFHYLVGDNVKIMHRNPGSRLYSTVFGEIVDFKVEEVESDAKTLSYLPKRRNIDKEYPPQVLNLSIPVEKKEGILSGDDTKTLPKKWKQWRVTGFMCQIHEDTPIKMFDEEKDEWVDMSTSVDQHPELDFWGTKHSSISEEEQKEGLIFVPIQNITDIVGDLEFELGWKEARERGAVDQIGDIVKYSHEPSRLFKNPLYFIGEIVGMYFDTNGARYVIKPQFSMRKMPDRELKGRGWESRTVRLIREKVGVCKIAGWGDDLHVTDTIVSALRDLEVKVKPFTYSSIEWKKTYLDALRWKIGCINEGNILFKPYRIKVVKGSKNESVGWYAFTEDNIYLNRKETVFIKIGHEELDTWDCYVHSTYIKYTKDEKYLNILAGNIHRNGTNYYRPGKGDIVFGIKEIRTNAKTKKEESYLRWFKADDYPGFYEFYMFVMTGGNHKMFKTENGKMKSQKKILKMCDEADYLDGRSTIGRMIKGNHVFRGLLEGYFNPLSDNKHYLYFLINHCPKIIPHMEKLPPGIERL